MDDLRRVLQLGLQTRTIKDVLVKLIRRTVRKDGTIKASYVDRYLGILLDRLKLKSSVVDHEGFPANLCISLNDEVIHGIPYTDKIINEWDLVKIDIVINDGKWHMDTASSFVVGRASKLQKRLMKVTKRALELAILKVEDCVLIDDVAYEIQNYVEKQGFQVVKKYGGHGIGKVMHKTPLIPNAPMGRGERFCIGKMYAIEPMVTCESDDVYVGLDKWVVKTVDKMPSAHFEHTILVRKRDCIVLT